MKWQRTERLIRIASRFLLGPSHHLALTNFADNFEVSKTVISDDVEIINDALCAEGIGKISVDRGRCGGARFVCDIDIQARFRWLQSLAATLSNPDRVLPGGLVYYGDIIFDPEYSSMLGIIMASKFAESGADAVMTSEVKGIPVAMFTAHFLGVPLVVCRFRNRASDGPAVAVHFPTAGGDVRTMYMGTRQLQRGKKVLIVDDFMRGGSTAAGMLLMAHELQAKVVDVGVFIAAQEPAAKAVPEYSSLLTLSNNGGVMKVEVSD